MSIRAVYLGSAEVDPRTSTNSSSTASAGSSGFDELALAAVKRSRKVGRGNRQVEVTLGADHVQVHEVKQQ